MLCKRGRIDDILSSSKRTKFSPSFTKLHLLSGKRKYIHIEVNDRKKQARLTPENPTDPPYLVISEIEQPKNKRNVWDDSLYGPDPRNHFARNHFATCIQRVIKGWLIRKKTCEEKLIKLLNTLCL